MYGPLPGRCHSTYGRTPVCSFPLGGNGCSPASLDRLQSSNTKKSRGTTFVRAARLQCHRSSPPTVPCRPCTVSLRGSAAPVSAELLQHHASAFHARRRNSLAAQT